MAGSLRRLLRPRARGRATLDRALAWRVRDRITIQGFFRSGTTHLQQQVVVALGGKSVFEPLSPLTGHRYPHQRRDDVHAIESYTPLGIADLGPESWAVLQRSARGDGRSFFSLRARRSTLESFGRVAVVKHVRLGGILDPLLAEDPHPALVLVRHPAAVWRSFTRVRWRWTWEGVRYRETFASQPSSEAKDLFLRHDGDALERFAVAWAWSVRGSMAAVNAGRARLLHFDTLVEEGPSALFAILEAQGWTLRSREVLREHSPTTSFDEREQRQRARADAWKELDGDVLARLEALTTRIYPPCAALWEGGRLGGDPFTVDTASPIA